MPNTPARYARTALTVSSATLFTVPASTTVIVTEIVINNTTAIDITPTINFGGVAFISNTAVPPMGMLTFGIKQVLSATDTITGLASAAGLNIFISGVTIT